MRNVGRLVAAVAGGVLLAGCGTAHQAHNVAARPATPSASAPAPVRTVATAPPATPSAPSVSTTVATAPSAAPSAVTAAALTGDQKACRAIEAHALPHTQQQLDGYMGFLSRESLEASGVLQTAIMNMSAGILGVVDGTVSEAQETARGAEVDALCAKVEQQ